MKKNKKFDPYAIDRFSKIPFMIQVMIIKWWAGGALFYYIGLGLNIKGYDLIVAFGVLAGVMNDYIVNRVIKWLTYSRKLTDVIFIPYFNFKSLFLNIFYGLSLSVSIFGMYSLLNMLFRLMTDTIQFIPIEPLLFGFLFFITDFMFLSIKKKSRWKSNEVE